MARVSWIGKVNTVDDLEYKELPDNAEKLHRFQLGIGMVTVIIVLCGYGLLCIKRSLGGYFELGIVPKVVAVLLSVATIFLHEYLHMVPYGKQSKAYIGIDTVCKMPFAFCGEPISKRKYILSSLLPALLGIVPLLIFIVCPTCLKEVSAFLWVYGTINLLTPAVDYIDVIEVCRKVPKNGFIQSGKDGFYYFTENITIPQ